VCRRPIIYKISEGRLTASNFFDQLPDFLNRASASVESGATDIQIREKLLPARLIAEVTSRTVELLRGTGVRVFVNDRADIAAAAGADGVHLTATSLPVTTVKSIFGGLFIAVSTHSVEELQAAKSAGADFAVFGPIFETPGKRLPVGLDALRVALGAVGGFPIVGLGGIDRSNMEDVLAAADGIAAIRLFNDPDFNYRT
jgi:thiamine-phosphate pyrophosphorylase